MRTAHVHQTHRHITIHMVSSLDGFVARQDNSIDWLDTADHYERGVTGEDPESFLQGIDCYVMGYRTYALALELSAKHGWPYGDKPTIVLTHRDMHSERTNVSFFSGDIRSLVEETLSPGYRNVWVVGGPTVAGDFIRHRLASEVRVTLLPILLGDGLPFFSKIRQEQPLHLHDVVAYRNGMVELTYQIPSREDSPSTL